VASVSSSAAVEKGTDSTRRFIRSADLRFRVPDVIRATYRIEDIVGANEGFVTFTNLYSTIDFEENTAISADSTLISTHFTVNNTMTLRVPNTKLDTTLKQIAPLIEFLDYRIIKATDVGLDMLYNQLLQKRAKKYDARVAKAVEAKGNKLRDVTFTAERMLSSEEKADQAALSNLALSDKVNFSTINLQLYQRQSLKHCLIANNKNIKSYEPSFGYQVIEALQTGLYLLQVFILFLLKIWWLVLLAVLAFIVYPFLKKRGKNGRINN